MFAFSGEKSEQYYDWFTIDYTNIPADITDSYKTVSSSSYNFQINRIETFEQSEWQTNLWYWADDDNSPDASGNFKTIDIDSSITLTLGVDTTLLIGGGARYTEIKLQDINELNVENMDRYDRYAQDPNSYDSITNLYSQIEHQFTDNLSIQFGVKAEYFTLNDTYEFSPQLRALYTIDTEKNIWFGVGRAIVTPSYFEQKTVYYNYDYDFDTVIAILANNGLDNESVVTIDVGYRLNLGNVSFDITSFISHYDKIRGSDAEGWLDDGDGNYFYAYSVNDDYEAQTYGVEVAIEWDINSSLKNYTSYSYLSFSQERVQGDLSSPDYDDYFEINHQNMLSNQLLWQVTNSLQWDFIVSYKDIDYKSGSNEYVHDVDSLISLDTRIGWKKHENAPLVEVIVKNIGMSSKCELNTNTYYDQCNAYETEQSIYGRVSYEF